MGGTCNFMIAAARLGLRVGSVAHIGGDVYGRYIHDVLQVGGARSGSMGHPGHHAVGEKAGIEQGVGLGSRLPRRWRRARRACFSRLWHRQTDARDCAPCQAAPTCHTWPTRPSIPLPAQAESITQHQPVVAHGSSDAAQANGTLVCFVLVRGVAEDSLAG